MQPEWMGAREQAAAEAWERILRPIAAAVRKNARSISETAVERFRHVTPEAFADPTSREQMRSNAEAGFLAIADSIERGSDPATIELPDGLLAGARSRAQSGFSLALVMRAHRLAHECLADWMSEAIVANHEPSDERGAALVLCSSWLFTGVDALATGYSKVYEHEREQWFRSAAAVRTETIESILAGTEIDTARASTRLGYELHRHHVGLITWIDTGSDNAAGQYLLETGIESVAADAGADSTLIEPIGVRASMAWISRSAPFEQADLDAALSRHTRVTMAIGEPAHGLEGFRRSHIEATHARRVATLIGGRRRATRYGQVELLAIATLDPERTRGFVDRALGQLTRDDDATRRLASTLSVYLQENCSRSRAAKRLGIHENTITYRIRQAQELLGHPIESDSLRLSAALALLPAVRHST
jgi:hypothetical protein